MSELHHFVRMPIAPTATRCSTCSLGQICLPVGVEQDDIEKLDDMVRERIRLKKGQSLFSSGEKLEAVYAIRFGTLKTHLTLEDGRSQITGFHLPGEIVGLDGIGNRMHLTDSTALEDSEVCVLRFESLDQLARQVPSLQLQMMRLLSQEIARDQQMLLSLGSMRAEERLAAFLLSLSQRLLTRGYSPTEFVLRMSREEIGSFLGLKLETVSRLFSRFAEAGLLQIRQRHIKIVDMDGLKRVAHPNC